MAPSNSYGTLSSDGRPSNGLLDNADQERAALLGKPDDHNSISSRLGRYMNVNVSKGWGDLVLLSCYIITGLLDSASVQVWGSFASMQTGMGCLPQIYRNGRVIDNSQAIPFTLALDSRLRMTAIAGSELAFPSPAFAWEASSSVATIATLGNESAGS